MRPDDHVCLCFHVSQRKLVNYLKREQPTVASQLSQCLNAGTGCQWCVPFLQKLHAQWKRGEEPNLPVAPEIISDIIQMVREALHNVQKHAGATRVAVAMEKADKALEISIDDNGSGFHFSGVYNLDELDLLRLGPVSLKQRARSLNAELQLESRPGRGSSVRMRIPV